MHRYLLIVPSLLLLVLIAGMGGCVQSNSSSNTSAQSDDNTILRVGITTNAPPMAYIEKGKVTGLEAAFARGLGRFMGRDVRFIQLKWEDQITALLSGKTDIIMSSMTITPARKYQIAFCKPYMISGQVSLVRLQEMYRYKNGFTDLLNPSVKIGTVKATTGALFVEKNIATDRKQRYFSYTHPEQGVKALLNKDIDDFIYDLPMNFYFAARNEANGLAPVITPLTREQIAWGVRKDDIALYNVANDYLEGIRQDGRLKEMLIKWIPFFKHVFNR
jgi:polar amino acid transport system substrate-binding protein